MKNKITIKNFFIKFALNYLKISPILIAHWYFSISRNQDPEIVFVLCLFTFANVIITFMVFKKELNINEKK